jgi:hypothetical protein
MSTTNLFVELIVIGVGAAAWLVLLVLSVFGWRWLPALNLPAMLELIPTLSMIYLLGILTDRVADVLFERRWVGRLRRDFFPTAADYHRARVVILTESERLAELLEYGRSRLRICRGWAINAALIVVALNGFVWSQLNGHALQSRIALVGSLLFAGIAALSFFAWRAIVLTEYRKVADQSAHLRPPASAPSLPSTLTTTAHDSLSRSS